MRKIAFIELDTHAEIASSFLDLSKTFEHIQVDFYFSAKISTQLNLISSANIFVADAKHLCNKLQQKQYDLVIIATAHRQFGLFNKIAKKFNAAIVVHNKNFSKLKKSQLFTKIFVAERLYRLKLWLKEGLLLSPELHQHCRKLVLDESLADSQYQYLPVFYNKFSDQKNLEQPQTHVVIPGAVDEHRRDYSHVFEVLKNTIFKKKFHCIFLGKTPPEMESQMMKLQDYFEKNNFSIKYFTEKVPQDIFTAEMINADVLWCPVQTATSFFSVSEVYGRTKMSGNIGDAVKYGKPAVFPANWNSTHHFVYHEDNNFEQQIELILNRKYDFDAFGINKVGKELENVLLSLL